MPFLFWLLGLGVVMDSVFRHFPKMGHDYILAVSWLNDYHYAWEKYGVFNIIFSPQRCGGIPVWANPIGANFSLIHVLSILFNDLGAISVYIVLISALSFYGARKFLSLLNISEKWKNFLSFGWCIQGFIVVHTAAGHLQFSNLGLWPLYSWILLKPESDLKLRIRNFVIFGLFYAHDFYSGVVPLFMMFPGAFLVLLAVLKYNDEKLEYREAISRLIGGGILATLLIIPKILAIHSFTKNFQREVSFTQTDLISALNYTFSILFFPAPLEYRDLAVWNYGNWESANYIYPLLFIVLLYKGATQFKEYKKIVIAFLGVFLIAVFINSGVYTELVKSLPIIKSFHVNPRWMAFVTLGIFGVTSLFVRKSNLNNSALVFFMLAFMATPILSLDKTYYQITYPYHHGIDVSSNRLNYCYEPVFGYGLELYPHGKFKGPYLDPRCYLGDARCSDYTLPVDKVRELETYRLQPFKN